MSKQLKSNIFYEGDEEKILAEAEKPKKNEYGVAW